jgi:hypothetical protein
MKKKIQDLGFKVRKGGKIEYLSALAFLFRSSAFDPSGPCNTEAVPNLK